MIKPNNKAGLTLIEVLVVLVILVVGILTVIQLFPAGFGVMHGAQNSSAAARLAQAAIETMKQGGAPSGIYASVYDADSTVLSNVYDPTVTPTSISPQTKIAGVDVPPGAAPAADVNKIRYIQDEPFNISAKDVSPIHVCNFGPIYITDETKPESDVAVKTTPWRQIIGSSAADTTGGWDVGTGGYHPVDDPTKLLTPGDPAYMVDYTNGQLAMAAESYPQTFVVSLQGIDTVSNAATTYNFQVTLAASYTGGWFPPVTNASAGITVTGLPGSYPTKAWTNGGVVVYRNFQYQAAPFTADPYQFNLNETTNPIIAQHFSAGVLAFNPLLSTLTSTQGIAAKVSYTVYDWHILHEDHELPSVSNSTGTPTSFRLAITDIKEVGDPEADIPGQPSGQVSTGVVLNDTTAAEQYDFMLLNLDDGAIATAYNHGNVNDDDANPGQGTAANIHVSFRNGRIIIPAGIQDSKGNTITHLRLFYRGTADWAVAVQRAPAQYTSVTTLSNYSTSPNGWPYFTTTDALVPGSATTITQTPTTPNLYYYNDSSPNGAINTIYFPVCDVGKKITLTNVVVTNASGQQMAVPTCDLDQTPTTLSGGMNVTPTYVSYSLLKQAAIQNAQTQLGGGPITITIGAVSGTSATAIVTWRERNSWKRHTLETILPPTS